MNDRTENEPNPNDPKPSSEERIGDLQRDVDDLKRHLPRRPPFQDRRPGL